MTYTLEEISAKLEIQDLLYRYAQLIDAKEFDKLDEVFTEDAYIDYTALGGSEGDLPHTIKFLKDTLTEVFPNIQHLNANLQITLGSSSNISEATGRIMCYNPMEMLVDGGPETTMLMCGLWYLDEYVKTHAEWKIRRRVEEKSWLLTI